MLTQLNTRRTRPVGECIFESKAIHVPYLAADGFRLEVCESGPEAVVWKAYFRGEKVSHRKQASGQPAFDSTGAAIRWAEQFLRDYADCQAQERR